MFRVAIAAIAALMVAGPAFAQQPATPAPDAARIAAAEGLLDAMHYDRQVTRTMDAVIAQTDRSLDAQLTAHGSDRIPADLMAKVKAIAETQMRSTFAEHRADLRRGTALIYARHFTVPELQHLAALQADPVLAKMQDEMPQIAADTMALTQALVSQDREKVRDKIKAAVEDYLAHRHSSPTS